MKDTTMVAMTRDRLSIKKLYHRIQNRVLCTLEGSRESKKKIRKNPLCNPVDKTLVLRNTDI